MKNEAFSAGQKQAKWEQRAWESAVASHAIWSKHVNSASDTVRGYAQQRIRELEAKFPQLKGP